jgi:hypothetical protein
VVKLRKQMSRWTVANFERSTSARLVTFAWRRVVEWLREPSTQRLTKDPPSLMWVCSTQAAVFALHNGTDGFSSSP